MTDIGIDPYLAPATLGDWLGANGPRYDDPAFLERIGFVRNLGLRWQRFNCSFGACCRPALLPKMTQAMGQAIAADVAPIVLFSTTGYDGATMSNGLPTDAGLQAYESQLVPVVGAFLDAGVRVFESHNEWNGPGVAGVPDAPRTAQVLAMTHSIVHALAEQRGVRAMVLPGGTASSAPNATWYAPAAYTKLLASQWGQSFDGSAHHAGAYPYDPHAAGVRNQSWNGFYQTQWVHDVVATKRSRLRTWVTEIPWPTTGPGAHFETEAIAASRAEADLLELASMMNAGVAGPVLVYHGCPDGAPGTDTTAGFGIRHADGSPKAVCDVLKAFGEAPTTLRP